MLDPEFRDDPGDKSPAIDFQDDPPPVVATPAGLREDFAEAGPEVGGEWGRIAHH
jgi:hypothetical protein